VLLGPKLVLLKGPAMMSIPRQSLVIASLTCLALGACGRSSQPPTESVDATEAGMSQPESSEMTEQEAIDHIRSLARSGTLKTNISESYWDFDRKEYRTRQKQVNIPDSVPWRATKNENGDWVVVGDFGLEGTQVHAEYVINHETGNLG